MVWALVFIATCALIVTADRLREVRHDRELAASPDVGDLTVLRIALDVAAIEELPAETTLQRLAATLRELRPRWRRAGATDFDAIPGGELRDRFTQVLREEDARVQAIAPQEGGPFREGDRREVVLVVLVIAASGALPDAIEATLVAIAALPSAGLVCGGIIAGRTTIADLATTYAPDELRDV